MSRSAIRPILALSLALAVLASNGGVYAQSSFERYRGRARRITAAETLLWIPRVVFFPLHALAEYGVRRPVRAITGFGEEHHVAAWADRVLNPTRDFSWWPSVVVDLGTLTSAGFGLGWRRALFAANEIHFSASTGGLEFWHLHADDTVRFGPLAFGARGDFLTRPDREYYGLGPRSDVGDRSFYRLTRIDATGFVSFEQGQPFFAQLEAGYQHQLTSGDTLPAHDPAVGAQDGAAIPPGFGVIDLFAARLTLTLDSRQRRDEASGFRIDLRGLFAQDVNQAQRRFLSIETLIEGAVEIARPGRSLVASLYVMDTQPLGSDEVPFTHMAILGRQHLAGFRWGRYIGPSAFVVDLAYRYPVWTHLDLEWFVSAGNVFGRHLAGFDPAAFAGSIGIGTRTARVRHGTPIQLMLALGTSRFDQHPFGIEGVRVLASVDYGL